MASRPRPPIAIQNTAVQPLTDQIRNSGCREAGPTVPKSVLPKISERTPSATRNVPAMPA